MEPKEPVDLAAYFLSQGGGPAMREPRAEIRQGAAGFHEMFVAYVQEGFTEAQAITLLALMFRPQQP